MRRSLHILLAVILMVALCACNPRATTPTATPEPVATTAPTATAAPSPEPSATLAPESGSKVAFGELSLRLPQGVATDIAGQVIPAEDDPALPFWELHPAYTEVTLVGYPSQNSYFEPHIQVYKVADLQREVEVERISALRALLQSPPATPPERLPLLPLLNAAQMYRAQVRYLDFQNGSGVRFVTQYGQAYMPASNQEVFYTFQGLTADGVYYISALLPIHATFLAPTGDPDAAVPVDGVPFPGFAETDAAKITAYYEAIVARLEQASAEAITPELAALDALVQSLTVQP